MRLILGLLLLLAQACLADAPVGHVIAVHDGDSLTVVVDKQQIKVRLADIAAPELRQAYGQRSKDSLAETKVSIGSGV